ncbi:unannotated protein [freshwater metagenome]|uniref:Unannotated protein n=1 Tax=freshwater metagenome TaxID=449393 RepID=A0A6J7E1K4_9ZZZZ|nr:hypothetical protein [Actinomycetota bacterium]
MARAKKTTENVEVAQKLRSWSQLNSLTSDPYVTGLIQALETKKNLPMWASTNPFDLLPHATIHSGKSVRTLNRYLTIARNTLVFTPVALTWIAVSKATTAFSEYTAKNSVAVVNFLEFWQNGYGVLAKEWTIGRVAFIDFLLIALIIALTLITAYLGKQGEDSHAHGVAKADEERVALALSIHEYLFSKQSVTTVTMNQSLARAVQDLSNAADTLDKSSKILEKNVKALPNQRDFMNELKSLRSRLGIRDK